MTPGTIDDLLAEVFPGDVLSDSAAIGALAGDLYPEEAECVRAAVERRRVEFRTGRLCARRLLAELGFRRFPLLCGSDRAAVWPPGVVGSISHSAACCAVAVARLGRIRSLGLDVETPEPLPLEDWAAILSEGERDWLVGRPATERGALAKLLFCAKESVFKCQFPVTGRFLDFDEVEVALSMSGGTFTARPAAIIREPNPLLGELRGSFRRDPRALVSGSVLLSGAGEA